MYFEKVAVFVILFIAVGADDCPDSTQGTVAAKLKNSLLCQYDRSIRPVLHEQNATVVVFRMILKYIAYDIHTNMMNVDAWITVGWKDQHLTWDPNNYNGITDIHMLSDEIWLPDLSVYNRHSQSSPEIIGSVNCGITSAGRVICVAPVHIESLCVADLTKYPYDTQQCSIFFGSWVHKGEEIDIRPGESPIMTSELQDNGEWKLSQYSVKRNDGKYACCPNYTYPSISINFDLQRLSGGHSASVVIPSLVLVIITINALILSPLNKDRLNMCYVNIISQFLHAQYVSWMIPMVGKDVPLILLFARDSLLLGAILLVFTFFLKYVMQLQSTPPSLVSTIVSMTTSCVPNQLVSLTTNSLKGATRMSEDSETIIDNSEQTATRPPVNCQDWVNFGLLLDRLLLVSYILTYFVMSIAFLP